MSIILAFCQKFSFINTIETIPWSLFILSIELINLYNNTFTSANHCAMPAITSLIKSSAPVISKLFVLTAFIKQKNLI